MLGIIVDKEFHRQRKWVVYSTYNLIEGLSKAYDSVFISNQQEYDSVKDKLTACYCTFPSWSSPFISHDTSLSYKKGLVFSDPHYEEGQKWVPSYVHDNEFDFILAYYYYPTLYHYPHLKDKVVHTTWCIPDEFATPIARPRGQDFIQIFGAVTHEAYTCRRWCHDFPFVRVDANSGVENPSLGEGDYYSWLGNFDAIITAGSLHNKYQLVTPKYYEVANSGALLFAQYCRDLSLNGFDESNCLIFNQDDFAQKAKEYLAEPSKYFSRRLKAQELIRSRHLVSTRVKEIGNTLGLNRKETNIQNFAGVPSLSVRMMLDYSRYLDCELKDTGITESQLSAFLSKYLKPDMVCVDVGANIGYYSLLFSLLANRVIAFEPTRAYRSVLEKNLALNCRDNVSISKRGLSDRPEQEVLITVGECSATLHFPEGAREFGRESIELSCLDQEIKTKIDVLKIDVDGHDFNVLKGGRNTIARDKPLIVFEVAAPQYKQNGVDLKEVYRFFKELSYTLRCESSPEHALSMEEFLRIADVSDRSWNFIGISTSPTSSLPRSTQRTVL